jgi:stage V sporulation protein B
MTYTRKIFFGISIVFIMNAFANIVAYLTRIFLARQLTPTEYGLFYAVFTFVLFFLFFRDLGLGSALVKYIAEFKVNNQFEKIKAGIVSTFIFQILSSLILSVILFLLADYLGAVYFKNEFAAIILKVLIIYIFLSVLFRVPKAIFKGFQNFKVFSLFEFSKNSIVLISLIILFTLGFSGVIVPTIAYIIVSPLLFIVLLPFALKTFPFFKHKIPNKKTFNDVTKKLFLFGIPVIFTGIGGKIIGYIDTLLLTHFANLEQVGIYNAVLPTAMMFLFIGVSVSSVIFPVTAELWARKDNKKIYEGLRLMHKYSFFMIIPILFSLFVYANFFIGLFFGEAYLSGVTAFKILLIGVMFYVVAGINNNIISGIGKPEKVTKIILFSAAINLGLNLLFIPKYGINGAAWATLASYLIVLILSTLVVVKELRAKFPTTIWLKLMIIAPLFLLLLKTINKSFIMLGDVLGMILTITLSVSIYFLVAYLFNIFNIEEIKKYIGLVRKK